MRRKLVENQVCLPQNIPSNVSVSRIMSNDLGYSDKILCKIPADISRRDMQNRCKQYALFFLTKAL